MKREVLQNSFSAAPNGTIFSMDHTLDDKNSQLCSREVLGVLYIRTPTGP